MTTRALAYTRRSSDLLRPRREAADLAHETAAAVLSEAEIAAVEWLGVIINAWNRIAIPSRYAVGP